MPTTRNRWQIETKQAAATRKNQAKLGSQGRVDTSTEQEEKVIPTLEPTETAGDHDINPRSPKRRRISSPEVLPKSTEGEMGVPESAVTLSPVKAEPSASLSTQVSAAPSQHDAAHHQKPPPSGPSHQTRLDNLSVLSTLSSQLLSVLAKMSPTEALQLSRTQTSQATREYRLIRSLFNPVRLLYLTNAPFLSPTKLGLTDPEQVEILRKANQAMYLSSIFTGEIGLRDMDQNFLEVFVPEYGKLLKAQGSIYLELKTQAFITARRTGAAQPLLVMAELFPANMESKLLDRRSGVTTLAPSEQDFLKRMSSRRDILLADVKNNTLDQLPLRYRWEHLSREVSAYLAKNFGESANNPTSCTETGTSQTSSLIASQPQSQLQGEFSIHEPPMPVRASTVGPPTSLPPPQATQPPLLDMDDFVAQAARAAEIAMQGPGPRYEPTPPVKTPAPEPAKYSKVDPQFQHYTPTASNGAAGRPGPFPPGHDEIPHSSQTAPTRVLYERARLAATAKASPLNRKPATPSHRRPWTPEEEAALMTGLDQVKGPHWSQILAMYGPGGTINESLKDRNQVQLKDKARNLKLFFLKGGIEVPYYLKYVTGDLKTRAPGQAEKQEARERERLQNEDHRAHFDGVQGIMALASSTQTPAESESPALSPFEETEPLGGEVEAAAEVDTISPPEPGVMDIEAMIARAAAQASEPMLPG